MATMTAYERMHLADVKLQDSVSKMFTSFRLDRAAFLTSTGTTNSDVSENRLLVVVDVVEIEFLICGICSLL